MGYGTIFVGFVLLLNIGYYAYTDLIAALLIGLGLSRLYRFGRPYYIGLLISCVLALIGMAELVCEIAPLFSIRLPEVLGTVLSSARYALIGVLSLCLLLGIRLTAKEVGLKKLASRCEYTLVSALFLYLCSAVLEIPSLFEGLDPASTALVGGIVVLLTFLVGCINLHTIYTAYARICMPEDKDMPDRPSRFAFVNEYRRKKSEREEQLQKERERLLRERRAKHNHGGHKK